MSAARPIRLGMVGGGQGAFIGAVHRIAARLDGQFALIAGAFSSNPDRSIASALELGIAADRAYPDFATMAAAESARADGIEAVAIVTPNNMHFAPAKAFLEAGIDVICDKPVTANLADAHRLAEIVHATGRLFILMHNYTGYPMIREARARVAAGAIGALRLVQVEYAQDWLAEPVEHSGSKQAAWRIDPTQAGAGGALGDIGTHAYNLAAFVTGQEPSQVLADTTAFGAGRALDDNAGVLLRYAGGARGMLWASQVAAGNENLLRLRLYGDRGGLEWSHEDPNLLWFTALGEPKQVITRNGAGAGAASRRVSRVPGGHPEGYLEGFATIYAEAAAAIRAARNGNMPDAEMIYPGIQDGVRAIAFVEACVTSSQAGSVWVDL
jgi:predicted dehydrogenase